MKLVTWISLILLLNNTSFKCRRLSIHWIYTHSHWNEFAVWCIYAYMSIYELQTMNYMCICIYTYIRYIYIYISIYLIRTVEMLHKTNSKCLFHFLSHDYHRITEKWLKGKWIRLPCLSLFFWVNTLGWSWLMQGSNVGKKLWSCSLVICFLRTSGPFWIQRKFWFEPKVWSIRAVSTLSQSVMDVTCCTVSSLNSPVKPWPPVWLYLEMGPQGGNYSWMKSWR